jgi:hypothetical protein
MLRANMVAIVIIVLVGCSLTKRPMPEPVFPAPDPIVQEKPSSPLPPSTRPTYNLAGYPKASQEGYVDGCETAKQSAYGFKDKKRYATDMQYRMGWDDGLSICRGAR